MKNIFLISIITLFTSNVFAQNCQNDITPPTIECVFSLAADTCEFGEVGIAAKEFILFSRDDCTDSIELNFSFTLDPIDTIAFFSSSSDSVSIWVTDAAGNKSLCNSSLNIVNDSCLCDPNLEITGTVTPACQGNDGSIVLDDFEEGNPPFAYAWNNDFTERNPSQLSSGDYVVTVIDNFGCFYTKEFTVPTILQLETNTTPTCNEDGTASVAVSGGTPPYQYEWNTAIGEQTEQTTNLSEGVYIVTVTDAEGCSATAIAEIENAIEVEIAVTYDCEGKGNIEITPQSGTDELFYTWSNGGTTSLLSDLERGTYVVTITDGNGCVRIEEIKVEAYEELRTLYQARITDNCDGMGNILAPSVVGGKKPYTYQWRNSSGEIIEDSLNVFGVLPDVYTFSTTDADGCMVDTTVVLDVSPTFEVEIGVTTNCEENTIELKALVFEEGELQEDVSNYNFDWKPFRDTFQTLTIFNIYWPREFKVEVTNNRQCTATTSATANWGEGSENCHHKGLNGVAFLDQDENCRYDSSEPTLFFPEVKVALVKDSLIDRDLVFIENDFQSGYTKGVQRRGGDYINQATGEYYIRFNVQKPYPFDYKFVKISTNFSNGCNYQYIPIENMITGDTSLVDFDIPIQLNENCELLTVDISTPFLRRCFESTYYVNYCNRSTVKVEDVYIEVQLDDFLDFSGSPLQAIALGDNLYRFDLGTLAAGECGQFSIKVEVSCDAVLGQTHCTSARIFPIPDCLDWSGAELQITAECEMDSVLFTIENIGEENMLTPSSYIAIEDVVAFSQGDFELGVQEKKELRFPKNGSTYRLRAQQVNGLPYPSQPTLALEGCGTNDSGNFSRGFVTQFSEDDAAIFNSIHCEENRGSYDPNDKEVFPKGVGALGQIEQNVDLEYKIRFQNTGTDTAFTVVILDTLDTRLDVSSVQAGASSHPYIFEVVGGNILRFQFNSILLPDSTTNLATSQGFVQFRVAQKMDVPLGETILNNAAIYFDFNEPIITNQVSNQVGKDFLQIISDNTNEPISNFRVKVSPNPLDQLAIIEIEGQTLTNVTFILYDFRGQEVRRQRISENKFHFYRKNLSSGGYFFKIVRHKDIITTGKLVLAD